ncbi:unnamed protein product [Colias eurytheme]|nr:unnamed protein product [Colias eurytheme]
MGSKMFALVCLLLIATTVESRIFREPRRLADPTPPPPPFQEVTSEKCDVFTNNYCGTLDYSNPQEQFFNGKFPNVRALLPSANGTHGTEVETRIFQQTLRRVSPTIPHPPFLDMTSE